MPRSTEQPASPIAAVSVMPPNVPSWRCTSVGSCVFVLGLAVIMVQFFGSAPLWHSDLWDHVNYGQIILQTGTIPTTEPLLVLTRNTPMVNTAWGAQASMAAVFASPFLGLPGLQFLNGLLVMVALAAVGWAIRRLSGSVLFAILGYITFLIVNWQQFLVIRPQLVGVSFFCILLAVLAVDGTRRRLAWFALPAMFTLWANLHGSFAMGLTLLGLFTVGRFVHIAVKTRSWRIAIHSRVAWRMVLLVALCSAAVLLNPNGMNTYFEVLRVGRHPNIPSMYEWAPLTLQMKQGKAAAVVAVLLLLTLTASPRRIRAEHVITLLATGGLMLWSSRMINWFAPVAALVLAIHAAAVARRLLGRCRSTILPIRRNRWTVVCLGLCCGCFSLTTLGVQTLQGQSIDRAELLSPATPVTVGNYLADQATLPDGLAFVPAEWSGYLFNVCGHKLRPMVNIHVHVIPPDVWLSYLQVRLGHNSWAKQFEHYQINYVVTQKGRNDRLITLLRNSRQFSLQYEDSQAVVFARLEPIP